jgi:CRP-like cAMP-binding protein
MQETYEEALSHASLFQAFTDRQRQQVASIAKTRQFNEGETMVTAGASGALAMWIILDGEVDVLRDGTKLATLGPGDHVGEVAVLSRESKRTADLVAAKPTTVLQITKWDLEPMVRANPDLAFAIIEELAHRLEAADVRFGGAGTD